MSNLPLKKLRSAGVITGHVVCTARLENASKAVRVLGDRKIVRVKDQVNSGTYWVMNAVDAVRMFERGYKVVEPTA